MLAYVKAENAYADAMLAHIKPLETKVYNEIIGRLQQDDSTVPYLMNGYWYFRRYETGKEYPIYARRKGTQDAPEEILLNVNELAKGHDFFEVGDIAISPDSKLMAWAEDTVGRRQYVVKVMDLATRKVCPIALPNVENNVVWAGDNQTFFYIEKDPETLLGLPRAQPSPRQRQPHRRRRGSGGLDAERRELLHAAVRAPRTRSTCSSTRRARCRRRSGTRTPRSTKLRIQGVPAARARPRIPGGARQRPLDRAHQLAGEELPHRRSAARRRRRPRRSGTTSSRIATTPSSTRSTCRATSSPSKNIPAACASCASGPGSGAAQDVFVTADEPSYTMALDVNREFDSDKLRYTYTSMVTPQHHLRLRLQDRQARAAQARAGARRLRPG